MNLVTILALFCSSSNAVIQSKHGVQETDLTELLKQKMNNILEDQNGTKFSFDLDKLSASIANSKMEANSNAFGDNNQNYKVYIKSINKEFKCD